MGTRGIGNIGITSPFLSKLVNDDRAHLARISGVPVRDADGVSTFVEASRKLRYSS